MNRLWRWLAVLFTLLLLGGGGIWWNLSRAAEVAFTEVEARVVERSTIEESVLATGQARPGEENDVRAAVDGLVAELLVKEGEEVVAGQVLLRFDDRRWQLDLTQARQEVAQAEADLKALGERDARERQEAKEAVASAEIALDEARRAAEELSGRPPWDWERYLAEQRLAEAEVRLAGAQAARAAAGSGQDERQAVSARVELARQRLTDAEWRLSQREVTAPGDGIVSRLPVEAGQLVGTGAHLLTIQNLSNMTVRAQVDEVDVNRVEAGQRVRVFSKARPDEELLGQVVRIFPDARQEGNLVYFEVEVSVPNTSGRLLAGMSVDAEIVTAEAKDVVVIPLSALREEDETFTVFVIEDGKAVRRQVETGLRSDLEIEVPSGLSIGEQVVTGPFEIFDTLEEEDPVTVQDEREARP